MTGHDWFVRTEDEARRLRTITQLSKSFAERAPLHDEEASFPHENIADLRRVGYVHWAVPKSFGGEEISLYEMLMHQEQIARGDGSTALAIGWHMHLMVSLRETRAFPGDLYAEICQSVVNQGALINSLATEPATGSPSRGGRPQTTAVRVDGGYRITGRKTFSTLSPALDWMLVSAGIEGEEDVGEFLVRGSDVTIEETWNTVGMRATGSHDVVLNQVFVADKYLVGSRLRNRAEAGKSRDDGGGSMMHIPACYLGVALNARDEAAKYAATYQPNSLPHPISEVAHIQDKLGQMELKLLAARTLMYDLARRFDDSSPSVRQQLRPQFGAVKTLATNTAIEVVDLAMRVVGARSLWRDLVFERLYRDVRAGLHNPPMDDITWKMLSKSAVDEVMSRDAHREVV